MKQKDLTLIIIVGFVSAVFSFVLSNTLFNSPKNRKAKAEVVQAITSDFPTPDKKYFNETSINPTKRIRIGDSTNTGPFNQSEQ